MDGRTPAYPPRDIVFDYYIGYGTNRFLAVYYGQNSDIIGPVRSGRFVDAQLVTMYSGILAYGSADEDTDEEINEKLGDYAISNLEAPDPVFMGTGYAQRCWVCLPIRPRSPNS